ncbi:MAG TPA: hypothetical protein DDW50_15450 [Firmicutes bacterium]|nr:hypothetical protein [Bacillota bacterium]
MKFDSSSEQFVASSSKLGVTSLGNGSTSKNFDVPSPGSGSSSLNHGASSIQSEAPTTNNGASSSIRELSVLIQRSARESLRIYFSKPDIPSRMARIILTLKERKKLSVAEMRQITGVSRNSIGRDMKVLKLLGWLEFHGSRKNGYFTLTASFPGAF